MNVKDYKFSFPIHSDEFYMIMAKLFLMGNEAKTDGVGIFVAEKWADSVFRVERHTHTHTPV